MYTNSLLTKANNRFTLFLPYCHLLKKREQTVNLTKLRIDRNTGRKAHWCGRLTAGSQQQQVKWIKYEWINGFRWCRQYKDCSAWARPWALVRWPNSSRHFHRLKLMCIVLIKAPNRRSYCQIANQACIIPHSQYCRLHLKRVNT